jgi:hypothetical protein
MSIIVDLSRGLIFRFTDASTGMKPRDVSDQAQQQAMLETAATIFNAIAG